MLSKYVTKFVRGRYSFIHNLSHIPSELFINLDVRQKIIEKSSVCGINIFGKDYLNKISALELTASSFYTHQYLFENRKINNCIVLDCKKFKSSMQLEFKKNIWEELSDIEEIRTPYNIGYLFKYDDRAKKSSIVFNNFDYLNNIYNFDEIQNMLDTLVEDLYMNKTYNIQLNISDISMYNMLYAKYNMIYDILKIKEIKNEGLKIHI